MHGIAYEPAAKSKSEAYAELLPLLNSGRAELLDNRSLVGQLCALERKTARGGRDTVDHPRGAHDDVVNAAAFALVSAAGGAQGRLIITDEVLRRAAISTVPAARFAPRNAHLFF